MNRTVEEPRIGVFICHCGTNIAGVVDVLAVEDYAKTLPDVVHAERNLYTCAEDGLKAIRTAIREHDLDRVIVASCTPRTHAPLFQRVCKEAGLNPYLFEFVNIRDQCSWVHMHEPQKATQKAKDLVKMGVAKAKLLEPRESIEIGVEPSAMVIGAGISGITCALAIANHGFDVYLIEKEAEIGGMLRGLNKLCPTNQDSSEFLKPLIEKIKNHGKITLYTSSVLKAVKGFVGNFDVIVSCDGKEVNFKTGTIIVATGADELRPKGLYGYGNYENVMTQLELEKALREGKIEKLENIVMIQCVGARGEVVAYCSKICCMVAIKNAMLLKERFPRSTVHILHNDIQLYGDEYEELYRKAKETGIRFIKYSTERRPEVVQKDGKTVVRVYHELFGRSLELPSDLLVLSTPLIQNENATELSKLLKVPLGLDKFYFEAHVKLRPADFATDGIYLCGTANGPLNIPESISHALGAASRALIPLMKGKAVSEAITAEVNPDLCIVCGNCERVCEYGAIKVNMSSAEINPLLCKGCGTCSVECPAMAITMHCFTDDQLSSMIQAAMTPSPPEDEPRALAFFCNWCSYAGADMAGVSRLQYPPTARVIRVMCTGRVNEKHILQAFLLGADGVLVGGCHPGDCHYISGNLKAENRIKRVRKWLKVTGLEPGRLRLEWVSAGEGQKLAEVMKDFTAQLKELGPSPLRR